MEAPLLIHTHVTGYLVFCYLKVMIVDIKINNFVSLLLTFISVLLIFHSLLLTLTTLLLIFVS
jgi:hypothetical protein